MTALVRYEQACRALADAKAVDEVKDVRDKAEAMRIYARQAKNRDLEIDAAEIRIRAERRLGELIAAAKEAGQISRGQPPKNCADAEQFSRVTLDQAGIDRKLSAHAQAMAAVPEAQFEELVGTWREQASELNARVTTNLLKVGEAERQKQARLNLAQALSDTSAELAGARKYPCIYADPAWERKAGIGNRSYENHYPTMDWDSIMRLPVADLVLPDAWLFLWLPRAHAMALHSVDMDFADDNGAVITRKVRLPLAWAIARAWGFDDYSTFCVWTKNDEDHPDEAGTGLIFRDQDEPLFLFKRGRGLPKPDDDKKFGSNHRERSRLLGHSAKPQFYREMIASMTRGLPVLELFARHDADRPFPPNWDVWGNQASDVQTELPAGSGTDGRPTLRGLEVSSGGSQPLPSELDANAVRARRDSRRDGNQSISPIDIPKFLGSEAAP